MRVRCLFLALALAVAPVAAGMLPGPARADDAPTGDGAIGVAVRVTAKWVTRHWKEMVIVIDEIFDGLCGCGGGGTPPPPGDGSGGDPGGDPGDRDGDPDPPDPGWV